MRAICFRDENLPSHETITTTSRGPRQGTTPISALSSSGEVEVLNSDLVYLTTRAYMTLVRLDEAFRIHLKILHEIDPL